MGHKQRPVCSRYRDEFTKLTEGNCYDSMLDGGSCDWSSCNVDPRVSAELCSSLGLFTMPLVANLVMSSNCPDGYKFNLNSLVSDSQFHGSFNIFTAASSPGSSHQPLPQRSLPPLAVSVSSPHQPKLFVSTPSPTSQWLPLLPSFPWHLPLPQVLCCPVGISALSARLRYG